MKDRRRNTNFEGKKSLANKTDNTIGRQQRKAKTEFDKQSNFAPKKQEEKKTSSGSNFLRKEKEKTNKKYREDRKTSFDLHKKNVDKDSNSESFKPKLGTKSFNNKSRPNKSLSKKSSNFKPSKLRTPQVSNPDGLIRLNRFISNAGICSRRDADQLIQQGLIAVNGNVISELGYKVKPSDQVRYEGQNLRPERMVYVLLNKPKDFITTMDDPEERKTVMDLVKNACPERIYPVGRLDRNTTGLLLLTNDGKLAEKLTHPSHQVSKIYQVDLDKPIADNDFESILQGVNLEDGVVHVKDIAIVSPDKKILGVEITEGRNRVVRRLFEALGYTVVKLDRVMYAGLTKKDLPRGNWRILADKEVVQLKKNYKAF